MSILSIDLNPETKRLRQFGLIAVFALPLLAALWTKGSPIWVAGFAAAGVFAGLMAWLRPAWLKPLYVGLTLLFFPIGLVAGEMVIAVTYFGVMLPIAMIFRLVGRDELQLKAKGNGMTGWQPLEKTDEPSRYFNQF